MRFDDGKVGLCKLVLRLVQWALRHKVRFYAFHFATYFDSLVC